MAFTATKTKDSVFGDMRVQFYTVTADAASGSIATGLTITSVQFTPSSLATMGVHVRANAFGAATASVGTVGFEGFVAGDIGYLTVYGK